ncbi:translocation/assembly module TamB domain-containing protein [Candidatus Dependentiae bacterium]|nr:translocation/assembly module TamB domain-containing protein [Candidatus Dependentiae bacterium]
MKIKKATKVFIIFFFLLFFISIIIFLSLPEILKSILVAHVSFGKDYKVQIGNVTGDFINYIKIENVLIENKSSGEQVLAFKKLRVEYNLIYLLRNEIYIKKLNLDNFYLNVYKINKDEFNISELLSFKKSSKKKKAKKTKKSKFIFSVYDIDIKKSTFLFNDNRVELNFSGVDFKGNAKNSLSEKDVFKIKIKNVGVDLYIDVLGTKIQDIMARDTSGEVIITSKAINWYNVKGKSRTGEFKSDGHVLFSEQKFRVDVHSASLDLSEIDRIFIHDNKKNLKGKINATAKIFGSFGEFHILGFAKSDQIFAYGQTLTNISSEIIFEKNNLTLNVERANWNEADVLGTFKLHLKSGGFIIKGRGENIDPIKILPDIDFEKDKINVSSNFTLEYTRTSTGTDKFTGNFWNISGDILQYKICNSKFSFNKEDELVTFNKIVLNNSFLQCEGLGILRLSEIPVINFEITKGNVIIENYYSPAIGKVGVIGKVFGPINNLAGELTLTGNTLSYADFEFINFSVQSQFHLTDNFPDNLISKGEISIENIKTPYEWLDNPEKINLNYNLDDGHLKFKKFKCQYLDSNVIVVGDVSEVFSTEPIAALNVIFEKIPYTTSLGTNVPPLSFKADGNVVLNGWLNDYNIMANVLITELFLGKYDFDPIVCNVNLTKNLLQTKMENREGSFFIDGVFFLNEPDISFNLEARLSRIKSEILLGFFKSPVLEDLSGKFKIDLLAGGTLSNPRFSGTFSSNIYNVIKRVELGILKGEFSYSDASLQFKDIKLEHKLYSILYNGNLPINISLNPMKFALDQSGKIKGLLDLNSISLETVTYFVAYLPFFNKRIKNLDFLKKIEGILNGHLEISGMLEAPQYSGHIKLKDGRIKSEIITETSERIFILPFSKTVTSLGFDIRDINASIVLEPLGDGSNRINLASFSGKFKSSNTEGAFILAGSLDLDNFNPDKFNLNFKQTSGVISLILPDTTVTFEDADITFSNLQGDSMPSITGTINVIEAKTGYDFIRIQDIFSIIYNIGIDIKDLIVEDDGVKPSFEKLSFNVKHDMKINLLVKVKDNIKFTGTQQNFYLNAREVNVKGTLNAFTLLGDIDIQGGKIYKWGHTFNLTKGFIKFNLEDKFDPELDMILQTRIQEYLILIKITGRKSAPEIEFSSIPELDKGRIFTLLFIHQTPDFLKDPNKFESEFLKELVWESLITEGFNLATSRLAPGLNRFFDVKRIKIEAGGENEESKQLYRATLGKYITPRMYLSYSSYVYQNPRDPSLTLAIHVNAYMLFKSEISLSPHPERKIGDSIGIEVHRTVDFNKYLFKLFKLELKSIDDEESIDERKEY